MDSVEGGRSDRKAIASAVAALGRKRGAPAKPAARKAQVIAIVEELLRANGSIVEADLKSLVEERLTTQGKSLSGFGLRFGEAMNDRRFDRAADGVINFADLDVADQATSDTRGPARTAAIAATGGSATGHSGPTA